MDNRFLFSRRWCVKNNRIVNTPKALLHQWLDLVFLIPTDGAYMLHIPLRHSMQSDLSYFILVCVCVCVKKTECRVGERR
jgi:hypothetical protein